MGTEQSRQLRCVLELKVIEPYDSGWERRKMRLRDFCHKLLRDRCGGAETTGKSGQKKNVSTRLLSQIDARSGNRVDAHEQARLLHIEVAFS